MGRYLLNGINSTNRDWNSLTVDLEWLISRSLP